MNIAFISDNLQAHHSVDNSAIMSATAVEGTQSQAFEWIYDNPRLEFKPWSRTKWSKSLHEATINLLLSNPSSAQKVSERPYHSFPRLDRPPIWPVKEELHIIDPNADTRSEHPPTQSSNTIDSRPPADKKQRKIVSEGFWNSGLPSRRPSSTTSIHSRSSSMNDSLHESLKPDPYQEDDLVSSSPSSPSRGLPAPPVDLKNHRVFECDLCGEAIRVERRRQWKYVFLE